MSLCCSVSLLFLLSVPQHSFDLMQPGILNCPPGEGNWGAASVWFLGRKLLRIFARVCENTLSFLLDKEWVGWATCWLKHVECLMMVIRRDTPAQHTLLTRMSLPHAWLQELFEGAGILSTVTASFPFCPRSRREPPHSFTNTLCYLLSTQFLCGDTPCGFHVHPSMCCLPWADFFRPSMTVCLFILVWLSSFGFWLF